MYLSSTLRTMHRETVESAAGFEICCRPKISLAVVSLDPFMDYVRPLREGCSLKAAQIPFTAFSLAVRETAFQSMCQL